MTQLTPRMVTIEVPVLELSGADGKVVNIAHSSLWITLKTEGQAGLRKLMRGLEHSGSETAKLARHRQYAIEWLLAQISKAYDTAVATDATTETEATRQFAKSDNRKRAK